MAKVIIKPPVSFSAALSEHRSEINLQWDSVHSAQCYIIEYFDSLKPTDWKIADIVTTPRCTITGLKKNAIYSFRVAAVYKDMKSRWSKTIRKKLNYTHKGVTTMNKYIKMFFIICSSVFILSPDYSLSQITQQWAARYNSAYNKDDLAHSVSTDASGNVYVTGNINTNTGNNPYAISILKYNSAGILQWTKVFQNPLDLYITSVQMVTDNTGNVYITGFIDNNATSDDYLILKYNSSGTLLWSRTWTYGVFTYSFDYARSIAVDGSGNVFVTGRSRDNAGLIHIATLKYNSAGTLQWVQRYRVSGWSGDHEGKKIITDASGSCYVTGTGDIGSSGPSGFVTLKYNSSGSLQWAQSNSGSSSYDSFPNDIAVDGSGNVYVTGASYITITNSDYRTIKYNSLGVFQWVKTYNGSANLIDIANAIGTDAAGNIYITGGCINTGTSTDFVTVKYNPSGAQLWTVNYNGSTNLTDAATDLFVDGSGNCYVTGYSNGSGSGFDYATIKYNSSGAQQWLQRYNGPANLADEPADIWVDNSGSVYVTGKSTGIGTMFDYATVKYNQTTGIEQISGTIPDKFTLSQNYPNPFNPSTNIEFSLPKSGIVKITVYDILGKEVAVIANEFIHAGMYKTDFDAGLLSSGTYFYRLETDGFTDTKKMILVK